MCKAIQVHQLKYHEDGITEVNELLVLNCDHIVKVEHSGLDSKEITRIILSTGNDVVVTDSIETVMSLMS